MGTLANNPPREDQILNGVLVQKDFNMSLVSPEDLREFAGLETNVVMQRLTIAFHGGKELLKWHLEQMFGGIIQENGKDGRKPMFKVNGLQSKLMTGHGCGRCSIRIALLFIDKLDWKCDERYYRGCRPCNHPGS